YTHSGGGLHSHIRISDTEMVVDDNFNTTGLKYSADYSSNFTTRSIPDIGYVLGPKTFTGSQTLRAGTATSAPLYFQNGTKLTTPTNGAMEFDGSHLYITIGSTRYQLDQQGGGGGS